MASVNIQAPKLSGYQRAIIEHPARFKIVEACTKSGKTFSQLWDAFRIGHQKGHKQGANVWWVAPTYAQAKIAFGRMQRWVAPYPKAYRVNLSELTITTPLGIIITFKTAEKPDNLYGEDVIAVKFDEFTRARVEAWYALRSTLTATGGGCTFIGNYTGETSWGHRLIEDRKGDPEYAYWKVTADDAVEAGIMKRDEVDQARKDLPHAVFMALYMCEGVHDATMLIEYPAIQSLWDNSDNVPNGDTYITADVARFGSDRTVIGVWHGFRLVHIHVAQHSDTVRTSATIKQYQVNEVASMVNVIVDEDGVGGGVVDQLPGCTGFQGGSKAVYQGQGVNYVNLKSQCYYELARMVNERRVHIEVPDYREEIQSELYQVRIGDPDKEGKLSVLKKKDVKAALGRSPDFADMMMMRMAATHDHSPTFAETMGLRLSGYSDNDMDVTFEERIG